MTNIKLVTTILGSKEPIIRDFVIDSNDFSVIKNKEGLSVGHISQTDTNTIRHIEIDITTDKDGNVISIPCIDILVNIGFIHFYSVYGINYLDNEGYKPLVYLGDTDLL